MEQPRLMLRRVLPGGACKRACAHTCTRRSQLLKRAASSTSCRSASSCSPPPPFSSFCAHQHVHGHRHLFASSAQPGAPLHWSCMHGSPSLPHPCPATLPCTPSRSRPPPAACMQHDDMDNDTQRQATSQVCAFLRTRQPPRCGRISASKSMSRSMCGGVLIVMGCGMAASACSGVPGSDAARLRGPPPSSSAPLPLLGSPPPHERTRRNPASGSSCTHMWHIR